MVNPTDELGELRVELRDRRIGPRYDERYARDPGIVGGRHIERLNVVAARRKHARHSRERPDLILQED